jgi:D-alanyl-D-alanine-carboxypeptidase/D-alanyl-D-alanine-endopeptidase
MFETILKNKLPPFISEGIGVVVGILDRGTTSVHGYGHTRDGASTAPDGRTLFGIGSISKVFTTTLLAALIVVEEAVEMNQPVRELLRETPDLPESITLLSLATHTSGLPRLPRNLWKSVRKNPTDPYANYTEADLLDYLCTVQAADLRQTVGMISYSNLGMGLLGYAVSKLLGVSYEEAVQRWVCRRLALNDTLITLRPELEQRLAVGHDATGKPTSNFHMPSLPGAGALYSSVDDLLRFLSAHVTYEQPLSDMLPLILRSYCTEFARPRGLLRLLRRFRMVLPQQPCPSIEAVGIGLGWVRARLPRSGAAAWLHNGGTVAYRSFTAFVPESRTGVVVLNNRGMHGMEIILPQYTVDNLGLEILDALNV